MKLELFTGKKEIREKTETEKVIGDIEKYIRIADIASPRFRAFSDYTDLVNTKESLSSVGTDNPKWIEYYLIKETIRQRRNDIPGYKKEYKRTEELSERLKSAIVTDMKSNNTSEYAEHLDRIKEKALR